MCVEDDFLKRCRPGPADLGGGGLGVSLSPAEGPAAGGELPGAVLHPSVHPGRVAGQPAVRGGKPVRGEEDEGPGGIRQGEPPTSPPSPPQQNSFLIWTFRLVI